MCSERYADDIPLRLPNTQLPPTLLLFSKQSNGMPASFSFLAAAMPDEPAPITQAVGRVRGLISGRVAESDGSVNFGRATVGPRPRGSGGRRRPGPARTVGEMAL